MQQLLRDVEPSSEPRALPPFALFQRASPLAVKLEHVAVVVALAAAGMLRAVAELVSLPIRVPVVVDTARESCVALVHCSLVVVAIHVAAVAVVVSLHSTSSVARQRCVVPLFVWPLRVIEASVAECVVRVGVLLRRRASSDAFRSASQWRAGPSASEAAGEASRTERN